MRKELKYYGFHACINLWKARPQDVIRVYISKERVKDAAPLLKWCAKNSKAYHIVTLDELCKVSDSVHHEGLCILAKELPNITFAEMTTALKNNQDPLCLLYMDGVQNPHNIGSIIRVCAHFGVPYLMGEQSGLPKASPSAYRIAQGGAECVKLVPLENPKEAFAKLEKMGFHLLPTSSHRGTSLYQFNFPPRTIVVMGSESEGVKDPLLKTSKETLLIPGTGQVESLNVSVATGLLLGEYWRQCGK